MQKPKKWFIVLSNNTFNEYTKMVMVLPITSNEKEFPKHYNLEDTKEVHVKMLCDHVRSIDYEIRSLKFGEELSDKDFISIITLFNACIDE